jgi:hypothetical protein
MTDTTDGETERPDRGIRTTPEDSEALQAVGTYESGDGVVFYDTENPLAWVQSGVTLPLGEMT